MFFFSSQIKIDYYSGWSNEKNLSEVLDNAITKEMLYGYTLYGAHKADIKFFADKLPAYQLSRSQQKLLVILFKIAQIYLLKKNYQIDTVLLLDDLIAEIDKNNIELISELIQKLSIQTFISILHIDYLPKAFKDTTYQHIPINQGKLVTKFTI